MGMQPRTDVEAARLFEEKWPELEGQIHTMARKLWSPGWTTEDFMQEFKVETWWAAKWWEPGHDAEFATLAWHFIKRKRADIMAKYAMKKRDQEKEERFKYVDTLGGDEQSEHATSSAVIIADDFNAEVRKQIGNAGRLSQILELKTVSKMEKAVMVCLAVGHQINETVDTIRRDMDESFDHKRFYRIRKSLNANPEVMALLRA